MSHAPLPADLKPILDDLQAGLRRRAAHRRRLRATAATGLSTLLLVGLGVSTAERMAGAGRASAAGGAPIAMFAADGLYGCADGLACWPNGGDQLNLPKHRSYRDR
jgi:hypothetical protein